jgi:hypothetical protein
MSPGLRADRRVCRLHASLLHRCSVALVNLSGCVAWSFGDDLAPVVVVSLGVDGTVDTGARSVIGIVCGRR